MKQKLLYAVSIMWIVVLTNFIWKQNVVATVNDTSELEQIWEKIDTSLKAQEAIDICYQVSLVAKGDSKDRSVQEEILKDIANMVEIENIVITNEIRRNGTSLSWEIHTSDLFFRAQYLDMEEDYIVLNVEQKGNMASAKAIFYQNCFQQMVEQWNLVGIPCMRLTAYLPNRLTFSEKNIVSENLFFMLEAKEIDSIRGSDLYMIYGYSDKIPTQISVSEQFINMNLSFSVIEETGETKLEIGIPILN